MFRLSSTVISLAPSKLLPRARAEARKGRTPPASRKKIDAASEQRPGLFRFLCNHDPEPIAIQLEADARLGILGHENFTTRVPALLSLRHRPLIATRGYRNGECGAEKGASEG